MPTPTAVDFPPAADGPLTVYGAPSQPWATDYGDGMFEACGGAAGWVPEVVTQPTNGTVTFFGTQSWRWELAALPALPGGNIPDSFTYRLRETATGAVTNTATVSGDIAGIF